MIFVESKLFSRVLARQAGRESDSILSSIQNDLLANPSRGDIVPGLAGIRKERVADPRRHKGKRGGYRYLYLNLERSSVIHLLYLFGKNEKEDLDADEKRLLRALALNLKGRD